MRAAIVGCGNIAQVHAWALSKVSDAEIVAFADCNIDKAREMSEKYTNHKAAVVEDYKKLFEEINPDIVHICTPHFLHVPMAIEALKRNISVFMEKPPAISRDEFEELNEAIMASEARIGFCFQNRYNKTTKELDRLVAENSLGKVIGARGIVTWRRDESYYSDDWHGKLKKEGGGVLINQSIHTLDLLLRYLGEPINIEASMQNHHLKGVIDVEDTLEAWMEFEDGKRACFYASNAYAADAPVIIELSFEKGSVTLMDQMLYIHTSDGKCETLSCTSSENEVGKSYWGAGHLACITDFYECIKSNSPYTGDYNGVKNTLYTTMKIYESAINKREGE